MLEPRSFVVKPVRWGLLPASGIATRAFAPAIRRSRHAIAVAVASRELAKAQAFGDSHGIARRYAGYDALLTDEEVEAVYISLPNGQHVEWAIRALEAGKHVLCEKPMDADPRNVARAFDVAERSGRLLMEAFMYRHHPDTLQIFKCAASGELGEIHHVSVALSFTMPGMDNIRLRPELQGGALMDVGCYAISAIRMLSGEPTDACGVAHVGPTDVDLRFAGLLKSANGAIGFFDCGLDLPSRSFLEVVGTRGVLKAYWPFFRPFFPHLDPPMIEVRTGLDVRRLPLTDTDPYLAQIDNFSRAIRDVEPPLLGRRDATAQAAVIDSLRRSSRNGREWALTGL